MTNQTKSPTLNSEAPKPANIEPSFLTELVNQSSKLDKLATALAKAQGEIVGAKKKSSKYHTTKDGRRVKKGLYYNINKKRKEGRKMRKKGAKGAPTSAAFKRSAKTAKKKKKKKKKK